MSHFKDSSGKIRFTWEEISYLCEIEDHYECGGIDCKCQCHQNMKEKGI